MTKLKTAKDLGNDENWIGRLILKKEAINWVKDCNFKEAEGKTKFKCYACERFMRFHNITEEDLK